MNKTTSKYIAAFWLFWQDMSFICNKLLSATVIGAPFGIIYAILSLVFSISNGIAQKLLKTREKWKKKTMKLFY